ncbi:hypothetical protein [Pseudomonas sp. R1-7]|uniref:hypothetical protein n=1 Tax=Pseudomonas sp. R1-7 TaxID=2817398 RepID=UPI003DA98B49
MVVSLVNSSVLLKSIFYSPVTHKISYVFLVDDVEMKLTGQLHEALGVRGVKFSDDLEQFLLALMSIDRSVSKKLCSLSWAYAGGEGVKLPIPLLGL